MDQDTDKDVVIGAAEMRNSGTESLKKLRAMMKEGLGFSSQELKDSVYPEYDLEANRVAEIPTVYHTDKKKESWTLSLYW